MAESDWLVAGVLVGVLVGIPIGWLIAQFLKPKEAPASVVFDRDQEGRISGIHYVPVGAKA